MNISWAECCNHAWEIARFRVMEQAGFGKYATLWEISHGLGGGAAKVLWTMKIRAGTFFDGAGMTESFGAEAGPLPPPVSRAWGKEPS
jgi:hypothetical protein